MERNKKLRVFLGNYLPYLYIDQLKKTCFDIVEKESKKTMLNLSALEITQ